jgi:hypothetical protein
MWIYDVLSDVGKPPIVDAKYFVLSTVGCVRLHLAAVLAEVLLPQPPTLTPIGIPVRPMARASCTHLANRLIALYILLSVGFMVRRRFRILPGLHGCDESIERGLDPAEFGQGQRFKRLHDPINIHSCTV